MQGCMNTDGVADGSCLSLMYMAPCLPAVYLTIHPTTGASSIAT